MNVVMQALNFPEEITSQYEIIQEMGRGAFSTVYKIKSKIDNNIYCLKKINIKKTLDKRNEINILSKLHHPNLVQYISSCSDDEGIYIIMEFCIYGDLYSLLHMVKKKRVYVNEDIIWDIAYQCLLGLEYLHSQHIIHRDIKLLNIFMSKDKTVKIGDMGMSKILSNKEMKLSRVGTPLYLAPELVKKEKYDYKADIWSLGCSLYHLARTVPPFNDENLIRLGQAIVNENPPNLPSCYSEKLNYFINKLMIKDKKLRPSSSEAMKYIPEKTKNKFDISNYPNQKILHLNSNNKSEKKVNKKNKLNNSKEINSAFSTSNSLTSNNQQIPNIKKNNELISGQTFYNFFKKNEMDKRKTQTNFRFGKTGNATSSQNILFDSKNMNSYLIMSRTMGGTREGFFKKNKNILNSGDTNKNDIKNNNDSNGFSPSKEQKIIENNNENKYNNINIDQKNNIINTEIKQDYKPIIIKQEKKIQNNINRDKIIIESKNKSNNDNKDINNSLERNKNNINSVYNIKKNKITNDNITNSNIFNFNNIKRDTSVELRNINHFFNKKSVKTNKSELDFFNFKKFGGFKSYTKEIPKNKNILIKEPKKDEFLNFPPIQQNNHGKVNSQRFENNLLGNNKIDIFRRTANIFPFQKKLTINDLK